MLTCCDARNYLSKGTPGGFELCVDGFGGYEDLKKSEFVDLYHVGLVASKNDATNQTMLLKDRIVSQLVTEDDLTVKKGNNKTHNEL